MTTAERWTDASGETAIDLAPLLAKDPELLRLHKEGQTLAREFKSHSGDKHLRDKTERVALEEVTQLMHDLGSEISNQASKLPDTSDRRAEKRRFEKDMALQVPAALPVRSLDRKEKRKKPNKSSARSPEKHKAVTHHLRKHKDRRKNSSASSSRTSKKNKAVTSPTRKRKRSEREGGIRSSSGSLKMPSGLSHESARKTPVV